MTQPALVSSSLLEQCIKPFSNFNNPTSVDFAYYDYRIESFTQLKLFLVSMVFIYHKYGMDDLAKSISLPLIGSNIDDSYVYDFFYDDCLTNGESILDYVTHFHWDYFRAYITKEEHEESEYQDLSPKAIEEFSDLFSILEDYHDPDSVSVSVYSSTKVAKYLIYRDAHVNEVTAYIYDAVIQKCLANMSGPYNTNNISHAALVDDTYYIMFLEGFVSESFSFGGVDVDMYYVLYAYFLDVYLDDAYNNFPIDEYYNTINKAGESL